MVCKRIFGSAAVVLIGNILAGGTFAHADALDGDWCNEQHGKLTIEGSTIETPGGKSVAGQYSRHRFEYRAPEGDWMAGSVIVLNQLSEEAMDLSVDGAATMRWSPCLVTS